MKYMYKKKAHTGKCIFCTIYTQGLNTTSNIPHLDAQSTSLLKMALKGP